MRIAIAKTGNKVSQHFGHCEEFVLYDIENGKIMNQNLISNPEHQPGFLPSFLKKQGVDVVIAGGMGQRAIDLFNAEGIKVLIGVSGSTDEVIRAYLEGTLVASGESCKHEHGKGHNCHY